MEGSFKAEGKIVPVHEYQIEASVGGKVDLLIHTVGDSVHAGDVILKLSNDDLRLNVLSQETALTEQINNLNNAIITNNQNRLTKQLQIEEAKQKLKRAERSYNANLLLWQNEHISTEEFLTSKEDYELASFSYRARTEEAASDSLFRDQHIGQLRQSINTIRLGLDQIRSKLDDLEIKAPINGVVTELNVNQGQIISTGATIAVLEDTSSYYVQVQVSQFYLPKLTVGQEARFYAGDEEITLRLDRINPKLINDYIQVNLIGEIPKSYRSGQFVSVELLSEKLQDAFILPQGQYLVDSGEQWVFVVDKSGKRASRRNVTFGFKNIRDIEVVSGLREGEKVITSSYKDWLKKDDIIIK
ncbi:MAG: efflux RND transporter periplasmic adaptor subunit [Gammaproteobacteria bacterium]|jgi:HlyD family secretion protein